MFDYKHLLPAPVFECNGLWYLRVDGIRAVLLKHKGGSPIEGFNDNWLPFFVYTGLDCMYLLTLERSGAYVTWLVACDGSRLGDKLTDLSAEQQTLLREAVLARGLARPQGLVGDGMQLIEAVLLRQILNLAADVEKVTAASVALVLQENLTMLKAPYQLQTYLEFNPKDETLLLHEGWNTDEAGICRGIGALSVIRSGVVSPASRYLLTISLIPTAVGPEAIDLSGKQQIDILIGGRVIGNVSLDPRWQSNGADLAFWIPPELVGGKPFEIVFRHSQDFLLDALRLSQGEAIPSQPLDPAELMLQFENIGDNCEFGLVQRHFNADPVGLLRFAGLGNPRSLIRFFDVGFDQFGQPGTLAVTVIGGEYWVVDHVYGVAYHTFRYPHEVAAEEIIRENEIKTQYLKRKFLEDLEDAEKILVYKRVVTQDLHEILALHAALNRFGTVSKLLWVTEADDFHAPGEVEWVGDRLLKGYVGHISLSDAHDFNPEIWLQLCRNAFTVFETVGRG